MNYRHRVEPYAWSTESFGKHMLLCLPAKHHYQLSELRMGPMGEVQAILWCSWLAARKFPGKLTPLRSKYAPPGSRT